MSEAIWLPNTINYNENNSTHITRIPDFDRLELRLADGATKPHLLSSAVIAAGLNGTERKINLGDRTDNNKCTDPLLLGQTKQLPGNLLDVLRNLEKNRVFQVLLVSLLLLYI